jgi:hypothetical protein
MSIDGFILDGDKIYIADSMNGELQQYSASKEAFDRTVVEKGASDGKLSSPSDLVQYGGNYYVPDSDKNVIFVYDKNFTFINSMGRGKGGISLASPRGIDVKDNRIFVADFTYGRIVVLSLDGYPIDMLNSSTPGANFTAISDVYYEGGKLYVADSFLGVVKVFQYSAATGDNSVLTLINSANSSLSEFVKLAAAGARLNITSNSTTDAASSLASAREYYNMSAYSSATSLAQGVLDFTTTQSPPLKLSIEIKLKQVLQSAQSKVSSYRQGAKGEIATLIQQFDNEVADANAKLTAKSYSAAVDAALKAASDADTIAKKATDINAQQKKEEDTATLSALSSRIQLLYSRLASLDSDISKTNQQVNTSGVHSLLDQANASLAAKDFASANRSLSLAEPELAAYESTVSSSAQDIKSALAAVGALDSEFNSTRSAGYLLKPDFSSDAALMAQAYSLAYTNPEMAVSLARQARDSASQKARDASTAILAVTLTVGILILVLVIAAGFYLYMKRRHKGL